MASPVPTAFFENRLAADGETAAWVFEDAVETWQGHGNELPTALARARAAGWWVVARLHYELGYELEPDCGIAGSNEPTVNLIFFRNCRKLFAHEFEAWLANTLRDLPAEERSVGVHDVRSEWTKSRYRQAVQRIHQYIDAGDCYQVNLTFPIRCQLSGHPLALYRALRERQPARYAGVIQDGANTYLSLSPELFVERTRDQLSVCPMKGTAARHREPSHDAAAAHALANCPKNRAENLMIVDLLRNDLGRIAKPGSIRVPALFSVEGYPSVWQMVSRIEAETARSGLPPEAILAALFPCGSITGAPKIRAMQIIDELERTPRGIYTGAIGWFEPQGDFRLNVAIRTLEIGPDRTARLGIGSGLVRDSDADAEWDECWLKARFLTGLAAATDKPTVMEAVF